MPNHVTNKLTFDALHASDVFPAVEGKDGCVMDFERLVPSPPNMYHGDLSSEDDKDFKVTWQNWCVPNWGTKWNAYDTSRGVVDGKAFIQFDTAWSVPYPVIAAFCNRFRIPFELRYFDEGENFWGIDTFGPSRWDKEDARIVRLTKRRDKDEDRNALGLELKGRDYDAERAEESANG